MILNNLKRPVGHIEYAKMAGYVSKMAAINLKKLRIHGMFGKSIPDAHIDKNIECIIMAKKEASKKHLPMESNLTQIFSYAIMPLVREFNI